MRGTVAMIVLAGCLAGPSDVPTDPVGLHLGTDSDLPASADVAARGLDAPPQWALGEWWDVHLWQSYYGVEDSFRIVVAGTSDGDYLVGFADSIPGSAMIFHSPHAGEVRRADLSHDAHDVPFKLLDFPLNVGRTWSLDYWGRGDWAELEVVAVDEAARTADITLSHATRGEGTVHYDAAAGTVTRFEMPTYGFEVTAHGFGHEGRVVVPLAADLVFCHGRTSATLVIGVHCAVGGHDAPVATILVDDVYDEATFSLITHGGPTDQEVGTTLTPYMARSTAPDGTVYEQASMPGDPPRISFYATTAVAGEWDLVAVAPGDGLAMLEGVAYGRGEVTL